MSSPRSQTIARGGQAKAGASGDMKNTKVPNADMQADDTGTTDSGVTRNASKVEGAMKQTSRTGKEHK